MADGEDLRCTNCSKKVGTREEPSTTIAGMCHACQLKARSVLSKEPIDDPFEALPAICRESHVLHIPVSYRVVGMSTDDDDHTFADVEIKFISDQVYPVASVRIETVGFIHTTDGWTSLRQAVEKAVAYMATRDYIPKEIANKNGSSES